MTTALELPERQPWAGAGATPHVPLASVCDIIMGQAPAGDTYNTLGNGVALIAGAGDFSGGLLAPKKFTDKPTKLSRPGDIVLSIRASIGDKVWADQVYCLGRGVAALRAKPSIDSKYLWHWVSASRQVLMGKARGATFLQVNRKDIAELLIAVPSLSEQRRIAAILDKADELRSKRRQALVQLGGLTQSIFLNMFGDVTSEDSRWSLTHLEDLASTGSGGTPSRAKSDNFGGTIPWIRSGDLNVDSITEAEEFITEAGLRTSSAKLIQPGAVLLAMYGATVGNSSILLIPATTNQAVCSIACGPNLNAVFLLHFLRSVKTRIVARGVGGAQPNISQGIIRKLRVPEVPLPLQIDFAERAGHVEQLQERQRMQLVELNTLFASLQHRAFKGAI